MPWVVCLAAVWAATADAGVLRVGTSGDYAPFSMRGGEPPGDWSGLDVDLARAYARERGHDVRFVPFSWPQLVDAVAEGRFDVAMSGITVRPERSAVGTFTVPIIETGAVVLVRQPERWADLDALDRPPARIAVNAGGHLERLAAARFPRATRITLRNNAGVLAALSSEAVDAIVTDDLEARSWIRGHDAWRQLGPFSRDRKAWLVRADRPDLAADLDRWLLAREADGTLARMRAAAGVPSGRDRRVATPLGALFAAIDERLALMPMVGAAKREAGMPLEVPVRERLVLDAAVERVEAEAHRLGVAPLPRDAVRAVFRAQIEAAKAVQWSAIRDPHFEAPKRLPDVDAVLRPALLRIGDRIARLLLALPEDLSREVVGEAARVGLRAPRVTPRAVAAIADAITALSNAER